MTFKQFLLETPQPASDEEYYKATDDFYNDPSLSRYIKSTDTMFRDVKTEKSDSGNLMIRYAWINNGDKKCLCILGMVSKHGNMVKGDIRDYNKWVDDLINVIKDGNLVRTAPNATTMKLVDKIIKKAESQGIHINKKTSSRPVFTFSGVDWHDVVLSL